MGRRIKWRNCWSQKCGAWGTKRCRSGRKARKRKRRKNFGKRRLERGCEKKDPEVVVQFWGDLCAGADLARPGPQLPAALCGPNRDECPWQVATFTAGVKRFWRGAFLSAVWPAPPGTLRV